MTKPDEPASQRVALAVLDTYKVRWSRETVARDIVQNFFDEVADFERVTIDVDVKAKSVRVSGPSTFDLDYLRYIGATTKRGKRTAGGFGEGFKICALVLVRDYKVDVVAGSAGWQVAPCLAPVRLGRELCYDVVRLPDEGQVAGSFVALRGVDKALCEAFAAARDCFRHPKNPRLQRPLHVDEASGVGVYHALDPKRGDVFYRKQQRSKLPFPKGAGLTFAFDDSVGGIAADRDRRSLQSPARVVVEVCRRLPTPVLATIVQQLRAYWSTGNSVLGAALREIGRRGEKLDVPPRWLAKERRAYALEEHAKRHGYNLAITAFARAGMPDVTSRFAADEVPRAPAPLEAARILVARELAVALLGEPLPAQKLRVTDLTGSVARQGGALPAGLLAAPFEDGIGPVLAFLARSDERTERTHNAGRLTRLLEGVLERPTAIEPFRERWERAPEGREDVASDATEGDEDLATLLMLEGAPIVHVIIAAPAGFPPAEALAGRIRRICRTMRITPFIAHDAVDSLEDALESCARGVPSVWIGDADVGPASGRPRYAVRTYRGDDGAPRLTPTDAMIAAVLEKQAAGAGLGRRRPRMSGKRYERGRALLMKHLEVHDRASYHERLVRNALRRVEADVPIALAGFPRYGQPSDLASALSAEALRGCTAEGDALEQLVRAAHGKSVADVAALFEALGPVLAGLAGGVVEPLRSRLAAHAAALVKASPAAPYRAQLLAIAPCLVSLCEAAAAAPLDETCRAVCRSGALDRFMSGARDAPLDEARAVAEAHLEATVAIALERHGIDAARDGQLGCDRLEALLDARFPPPAGPPTPRGDAEGRTKRVAERVRAAWDEAIAAGLSEIEAAGPCLAAASAARAASKPLAG